MSKIWETFENLNEYVFVSDMDTDNLIYLNKKTRMAYGIADDEDYTCRKCYELLQSCKESCPTCNNGELVEGQFREWEYFNPVLDKYLTVKTTMIVSDGVRCRFEIAIDIGIKGQREKMLVSYQNMEMIVHEGIKLAMQVATPDESIDVALEYLGKALKSERSYIFEKNKKGNDDNTYEWVAAGITAEKDSLQDVPAEICAHWYEEFSLDRTIIISDIENVRESDLLLYETLSRQGIRSLVVVPLYDNGRAFGFFGVDNPMIESLEYASDMLQIMGYFIVAFIRRRTLLRSMEDMSLHDQLTHLGNRYAMNAYFAGVPQDGSIGVVYCDITGLKRVNDTEGHLSGDRMIVRACESLARVFDGYGVFRIGGDELLALCIGIGEKELEAKTVQLRQDAKEQGVILAVGSYWSAQAGTDTDGLLSSAETKMYEDKDAYYRSAGIDRRKN